MSEILERALKMLPQMSPDQREVQLKLLIIEQNTAQAALDLRKDFTNEDAKTTIVTKFFYFYDTLAPEAKVEFRDSVDDLGKKYIDAWTFAGIYNFPYRDAVAATYLSSIAGRTDQDIAEHIIECKTLEKAIKALQKPQTVV